MVDDIRRCCCCCFWCSLDRLLRTDCESLVALLVDALRWILCHVVREAGWTDDDDDDDEEGAGGAGEEQDCLVEKLSLLATVEGVAGYGIELGLAFLDAAAPAQASITEDDDVEARRPDRLQGFLGEPPLVEDPAAESPLAAPALAP